MTVFNDNALRIAPWSATKLKIATKCPFRAYQAFIAKEGEKFNEPQDESPKVIGIKVHSLMELILGKFPKDKFPDMKSLQALSSRMLEVIKKDEDLTYRELDAIDSMYIGALNVCQRFLSHKLKIKAEGFIEIPVGIDKNLQPADFFSKDVFFRGKVDYMLVSPSGNVAIIDAKTGAWPSLKGHAQQLRCYEVLTLHGLKNKLKDEYNITLTSFISGLAFVASEDILWDSLKPLPLVEGYGTQSFINSINKVSDAVFEKEIKRGNHCNYCGYKHLCGSKRGMKAKKKEILM